MITGIPNDDDAAFVGLHPPDWDEMDFDEMEFFKEAQEKAHQQGLAIVFVGQVEHSCDIILLHDYQTTFRSRNGKGPFQNMLHAVEFTGDYVTDLTYLWKSFENMGQLESRFASLNTPTRWDCRHIGEA